MIFLSIYINTTIMAISHDFHFFLITQLPTLYFLPINYHKIKTK